MLRRFSAILAAVFLLITSVARSEVLDAEAAGFTVEATVLIDAPRSVVYSSFVREISRWWNPELTISGFAEAMYLDARPMGCLCEALGPGDGIVHLTVTLVNTNRLLRFTGGLGPLGLLGVAGNMTFEFNDAGDGSRVTVQYAVGGYRPQGLDGIAAEVDYALTDQLSRLKHYVESLELPANEQP